MEFKMQVQKKKNKETLPSKTKNKKGQCNKGWEYFRLFCVALAAWPSGKAGDCKSFFPSSNPGVA